MAEAFTVRPERVISLEQQYLIDTARQLLNESPGTHHGDPWTEGWRPTTLREKFVILLGGLSLRSTPPELEQAHFLCRPEGMESTSRVIATDVESGQTFELVRQVFVRFGESRVARERLVVYGAETRGGQPDGSGLGGCVRHLDWWQDLLQPIEDPEVVARLQDMLGGALERAQREHLSSP